ncbi:MAG: isocitrate dehydrogenase (NADP(+)) [Syntrophaceae bacterium]|mgnify:CR=1 FL=1|nr:isocitrate dehydrogenase (NADP(+)) [Syntrophaceae bacterium]
MGKSTANEPPKGGEWIKVDDRGSLQVPNNPIVGFIQGDGVGPDIWAAARPVFEASVKKAYGSERQIVWYELVAGEKCFTETGQSLSDETLEAITQSKVVIKGPLTTPVGGGFRSLNVTLRQKLDLYSCIRPVKYLSGTPAPVLRPEDVDIVIFRENTEDVYAGIEWKSGSPEASKIIDFLKNEMGVEIDKDSGIGVKPMSPSASKRLIRRAIAYAIENNRRVVTLVHKGNIMKFTEGAFRDWGYEVAQSEFADSIVNEKDLDQKYSGKLPEGKILLNDRIADSMFQQALLRPREYDVLAMPNLNGDYMSDALAAQVGGLGMAPGANVGDGCAVFEATHGSAPKYAGLDKVNPGSMLLSGVMMFDHMGWREAGKLLRDSMEQTIKDKVVTYDLARLMEGATEVSCSGFAKAIIDRIGV